MTPPTPNYLLDARATVFAQTVCGKQGIHGVTAEVEILQARGSSIDIIAWIIAPPFRIPAKVRVQRSATLIMSEPDLARFVDTLMVAGIMDALDEMRLSAALSVAEAYRPEGL